MSGTKYVEVGSTTANGDCGKCREKARFPACSWQFKEQIENGKTIDTQQASQCTQWGTGSVFLLLSTAALSFSVYFKKSLKWEIDTGTANCHSGLWLYWAALLCTTWRGILPCNPEYLVFYKRWEKFKFLKFLLQMMFKAFLTNVSKVNSSQQS